MKIFYIILDIFLLPATFLFAALFYFIRVTGDDKFTLCNKVLLAKGILPVKTYFEESLKKS